MTFTSLRVAGTEESNEDYFATSEQMLELAAAQPGYLGIESVRDATGFGITVSYWRNDLAARMFKEVAEHRAAQERGRSEWYVDYQVHVATVCRSYSKAARGESSHSVGSPDQV